MRITYRLSFTLLFAIVLLFLSACRSTSDDSASSEEKETTEAIKETFVIPSWAKSANIYEVNIRQYTPEGTFTAFTQHLPRLKEMEVDILWLMPIFPISETKRKGTLGSYYAVSDFTKVNPEFGTIEDFENLVNTAHDLGIKVILDWVPNHTGWDHQWLKDHPEYYTQDEEGNPIDPIDPNTGKSWGWTDVADLNYDNKHMRAEQIEDMLYWVNEIGTNGFRFDVAHSVPLDFWHEVKAALLEADKDQFLLAEAEIAEQMNSEAFHMAYGWGFHHKMNEIAKGEANARSIDEWLEKDNKEFTKGIKMHFTSNHDENSWAGTVFERMPDSHKTFAVLVSTFDGMPLLYGGQEEPLDKRLEFFEKDDIGFKNYEYADFYTRLNKLKHDNQALWNEPYGGPLVKISDHDHIYAFSRSKGDDEVVVMLNLSKESQSFILEREVEGLEIFNDEKVKIPAGTEIIMSPWEYRLISNN